MTNVRSAYWCRHCQRVQLVLKGTHRCRACAGHWPFCIGPKPIWRNAKKCVRCTRYAVVKPGCGTEHCTNCQADYVNGKVITGHVIPDNSHETRLLYHVNRIAKETGGRLR